MTYSRALSSSLALLIAVSSVASAQRGRGPDKDQKEVPPEEQHKRVVEQQQRVTQYKQHVDQEVQQVQRQRAQLQQDHRSAQYAAQETYERQLRDQQQRVAAGVSRDYSRDPYVITPHSYRYSIGGHERLTNQYGADVLRRAVNSGYEQGVRAGEADRRDHWRANYQNAIAYRDADYGYDGNYIDLSDYNYYFREGFRRGYDDGYNARWHYGVSTGNTIAVAAGVLASILVLKAIH